MSRKPSGPGPGAYRLPTTVGYPSHDPSRYRNPMFSFGTKAASKLKPLGPGPAYRIDRVTREGLLSSPAWSFGARMPMYSLGAKLAGAGKATRTPGPATYPPNLYNTKKNPYSYSFGTRHGDYAPPMIIKEDTMDCL